MEKALRSAVRSGFRWRFCHAVTQGQQGWSSYGPSYRPHQWKRRYCMNCTHSRLHPRPRLAAGKEAAILHGSTPCWCRQTCEPSEWVSEEYVCAPMQDGTWVRACVFSNCFSRDAGLVLVSSRSTVFSFACTHASRLRLAYVQRACPSQDRRVYAAVAPSQWMARVLLAVRTSSRMQEIK